MCVCVREREREKERERERVCIRICVQYKAHSLNDGVGFLLEYRHMIHVYDLFGVCDLCQYAACMCLTRSELV